ncbi:MAG: 2-hydroxyglutaryl-CoA dehydratase [Syntrophaceae bacterium]|nr:2-hydroxyglutaryl-CoA dehydratase [Syntrophaceae bacterium]
MIIVGCDVGSLTAECVILKDGNIYGSEIIRVRPKPEHSASEVTEKLLARLNLTRPDIDYCISTGYGRENISFADDNISEIKAHSMGAHFLNSNIRTIIDVGGQDCKAIRINERGDLDDFIMNDKCAAGTGRSLEIMSESLGVDISELGALSMKSRNPVKIASQCSIFADTEIFHYLCREVDIADIAAGINEAMARRVKTIITRVGIKESIAMTGGVAKNTGVVKALEGMIGTSFVRFEEDPQIVGALGAAVFGYKKSSA